MDYKDLLALRDWLNFVAEWVIVFILLAEYFWGRPDITVSHEEGQKVRLRKARHTFEGLTTGEGK